MSKPEEFTRLGLAYSEAVKKSRTIEHWIEQGYYGRKHAAYNTEDPAIIDALVKAELATNRNVVTLQNVDQDYAWASTIALIEEVIGTEWGRDFNEE